MTMPLKQSVRDHLDVYTLSEDQLNNLESLAGQNKHAEKRTAKHRVSIYPFTLAGAVAVFLFVFFLTPYLQNQSGIQEKIAMEVAANHIKLKPLEIETSSIEAIRNYFKKLDFVPVNSQVVSQLGLELIGGRYCSLQGNIAAQLRVRKPGTNTIQTLYQTEYRKDVFENMPTLEEGGKPVDIHVKGVKVTIWVEKGLLFALTDIADD
jgi:hypothetical protein